jgi:diguanylate cyclase (GGDEF)-like protein
MGLDESVLEVTDVQQRVQSLEDRDFQLWSIAALVLVVLAGGLAMLLFPNVIWNNRVLRADGRYLPQLLYGLITLVILFNIYLLKQRLLLRRTREELVHQIMYTGAVEKLTLTDPLTKVFNRRYLDEIITKDVQRADRLGTTLTLVMIDVDDFKDVNTRFGHLMGDRLLNEVANVLRATFRGSDTIVRYGGDEFLLILESPKEHDPLKSLDRLAANIAKWNVSNTTLDYKMGLTWGFARYEKGRKIEEVLDEADRKMLEAKKT